LSPRRWQWDRPAAGGRPLDLWSDGRGRAATSGCPPAPHGSDFFLLASLFFPPSSPTFGHFGQLHLIVQHMPALPRVHLKTSNTHNFWTVAPNKIMKFALTRSFFRDASSQKVSNNLKIVWDHTTQPRTGLSPVETSGPLGDKLKILGFEMKKIYRATVGHFLHFLHNFLGKNVSLLQETKSKSWRVSLELVHKLWWVMKVKEHNLVWIHASLQWSSKSNIYGQNHVLSFLWGTTLSAWPGHGIISAPLSFCSLL
jgi:hypothetical protein